jgi:rSAM/selenodomain-associated transferase 1
MLKEPVMGRVKTRLAREIGSCSATGFARIAGRSVVGRLARDSRWRTVLAITPDSAVASGAWPAATPRIRQGGGDLGERMARLLGARARPAILIGADIPAVTPAGIAAAFRLLRGHDAVFGPAEDGGYWLVGLNKGAPAAAEVFRDVSWSTPRALADTLANLRRGHIAMAARLGDVDDAASHRRWGHLAGRLILPAVSGGAASG